VRTFGPVENHHCNHILDVSLAPAGVDGAVAVEAVAIARRVASAFELEGLICVEMFVTDGGDLLVNEMAPRPHNSGHLTIEASVTGQFEQQVRALCNLPLGDMSQRRAAAMVNLLGDYWADGDPDWSAVFAHPEAYLHLYGKDEPRVGRKMGHLTVLSDSPCEAFGGAKQLLRRGESSWRHARPSACGRA